jgi:tetratricopeptide (TPR) repeat protein
MGRLTKLHHTLVESYNDNDGLRGLCLALDVRYDDLRGETFSTKAYSLIRHLEDAGRLPDLLAQAKQDFPNRNWEAPNPPDATATEEDAEVYGQDAAITVKNNTGNIAIGSKNVIQIGTLNLPRNLVLMGLAAVLGVGAIVVALSAFTAGNIGRLAQPTATPKIGPLRMSGTFNVAIANFPERDLDGRQTATDDGFRISTAVFNSLSAELKTIANAQVWHDSLSSETKGTVIGIITGTNEAERQANAKLVAQRIGAHMLIYGDLNKNASGAEIAPEFFIDAAAIALNKETEAEDVTGRHKLGAPVQVPLPFKVEAGLMLDDQLQTRALFVRGLLYDLIGAHDKALADFKLAQLSWSEQSGQGKETLDFFLGREALFLWVDEPRAIAAFGSVTATLDYAEARFKASLFDNPNYALGNWGLGTTLFRRAEPVIANAIDSLGADKPIPDQAAFDEAVATLTQATDRYRIAAENIPADTQPQLLAKVRSSLANAYRLDGVVKLLMGDAVGAQQRFNDSLETAQRAFTLLDDSQPRSRAIAYFARGASYQGLASVALMNGDSNATELLEKAKIEYTACLNQYDDPTSKTVLDSTLRQIREANCQANLALVEQALTGG